MGQSFEAEIVARVRRVTGASASMIPPHAPLFARRASKLVKDCLDIGWVSSVGSHVDRFVQLVAEASGMRFGVAVGHGTAAPQIALLLAGGAAGDVVVVPTLTFAANANAVV